MQRMSVAAGSTLRFYTQQCLARSHAVCLPAARMASTRTVQPGASAIFVGGECRREGSAGSAGASVHARRLGTTAVHGARRKPQRRAAVVEPDEPDEPDFLMDEREAYGGIESEGGGDGPPLTALESMAHQAVQVRAPTCCLCSFAVHTYTHTHTHNPHPHPRDMPFALSSILSRAILLSGTYPHRPHRSCTFVIVSLPPQCPTTPTPAPQWRTHLCPAPRHIHATTTPGLYRG